MNIYDEIGVHPFINAGGWMYTRYGGSIMPEAVVAAMAQASRQFVNIYDLQNRVGQAIAEMTQNESAFVSCGAASGITLAVATCIAGTDSDLADRLPDTQGMRNQVIMSYHHRGTEADPAVRAGGGKIIHVGSQAGNADPAHYLSAISDQTAAILIIGFESEPLPSVRAIVEGAHAKNIPVLIDGACIVPPKGNLWRYTRDLGVDAFITSGGKAIHGPQSTGLVVGKKAIIEGCKYHSSPNLRIGRGMKVGKEEFAGIFTALKLFLTDDLDAKDAAAARKVHRILEFVKDIPGLKLSPHNSQLHIDIDPQIVKTTAESAAKILLETDPSILLRGKANRITVKTDLLQPGEDQIVGKRLREILTGGSNAKEE